MQVIVELANFSLIKKLRKFKSIKHFIVNYKSLSFNAVNFLNLDEIKALSEMGLSLILNAERLFSDELLLKLSSDEFKTLFSVVNYITYSDFGLKEVLVELGFENKLIFRAPTYLTNYCDINLYNDMNEYVVASSEISSEELKEVLINVNKPVIIDLFGKSACFYSRRELLTNYFKYRQVEKNAKTFKYAVIEELRNDAMNIIEDETGTRILEPHYHTLAEELKDFVNVSYGIINTSFLNQKQIISVVKAYDELLNTFDLDEFYNSLNEAKIDYYKGAYNIKSVLLKGGSCNE